VTGLILPSHLETDSQLILEQFAAFSKGFDARVFRLPDAREEHPLLPYTPGLIGAGANTVVRADVARRLGGFDTDLGTGTPAAGGEDLDLYIRLLRGGHAVAYEPSAIVWHEHPDGSFRLRSQVYRYGVGLGATLTKQLARGPERLELLRSVPAGVRYAREPSSRKNAGKTDDYPHGLNWLERVGMLLGPAAYLASSAMRRLRRRRGVAEGADANAPAMHVHRAALSSGRSVDVVSFLDLGLAPPATADRRLVATGASTGALVVGATLACLIAPLAVALDMPAGVRFPVVLALVCLVPGTALVALVRGRAEPGLIVGLGLAATAVLAQTMLWLDAWSPEIALYALATLALPVLVSELDRGRRSVSTALRQAIDAMPPAAALHAAILSAAMGAWTLSLHGAELDQIAGIGLLSAMPPTYFLAVLLLLVGFAVAVNHSPAAPKTLGLYVVALVVVVHATTPLLYDHPRYMWTYNHLGVISLIAETGAVDRDVDIYNNWPAFFASNAWLSGVTGLSPGAYAPWAQLFFGLTSVAAMRFALRGVTADERLLWTAAWFFVLANWVAQDYLAPQALGFVLSLVVLGLCLRCSPRARSAGRREDLPPAPLSPRAAVVVGGLLYLAIVTSHQLSPLMLLASVLALALIGRRVPLWVPAAMALVEAWWVALALPYLSEHFSLLDFDLAASAAPSGYEPGDGLPGSQLVAYAARLEVVLMVALALAGVLRRWRAGYRDVVVGSLALAPLAVCLAQSYGGEGRFRVYLFALPWLCLLAAAAFIPLPRTRLRGGLRSWRLALASGAAAVCLLFSYFGLELINRVTADDVEAAVWFERHAPPDSLLVGVTPSFPRRLTADYARVHDRTHPGTPGLTDRDEGLRRGTLGPADLPRVESTLRGYGGRRKFLILTPSQERFGRLYGILPAGGFRTLGQALAASPSFRLVFRRERSSIFEYRPRSGRSS
jgi:hypothetical protein